MVLSPLALNLRKRCCNSVTNSQTSRANTPCARGSCNSLHWKRHVSSLSLSRHKNIRFSEVDMRGKESYLRCRNDVSHQQCRPITVWLSRPLCLCAQRNTQLYYNKYVQYTIEMYYNRAWSCSATQVLAWREWEVAEMAENNEGSLNLITGPLGALYCTQLYESSSRDQRYWAVVGCNPLMWTACGDNAIWVKYYILGVHEKEMQGIWWHQFSLAHSALCSKPKLECQGIANSLVATNAPNVQPLKCTAATNFDKCTPVALGSYPHQEIFPEDL